MALRAISGSHDGGSCSSSRSRSEHASASEGEERLLVALVGSASIQWGTELISDHIKDGPGGGPTIEATAFYVREMLDVDVVDSRAKEDSDQYQLKASERHGFALARSGGKANDLASMAKSLRQQKTVLPFKLEERNGVSKMDLDELIAWLGPQVHSLTCFKPKLVELFEGPSRRLSPEVVKQEAAASLHYGLGHDQNLVTWKGFCLTGFLTDYLEPEDVWCARVCRPWSTWPQVNEVEREGHADTIPRGRTTGRKMLRLYDLAARKQWQGYRHVHGENPRNSLAYKEKGFHEEKELDKIDDCLFAQNGYGLSRPWWQPGMPRELQQKWSRVDLSRPNMKSHLNSVHTKFHQEESLPVPFEGRWRKVALTEWAGDSNTRLASSIAEGLDLPRQTKHQAGDGITMDLEVFEDLAGVQVLDILSPGENVASIFGMVELEILKLHDSNAVATVFVEVGAVRRSQPQDHVTRKSAREKQLTDWNDSEGVIVFASPTTVGTKHPLEVDVAVFYCGGTRSRLRAWQHPRDSRAHGCTAWLRNYHQGILQRSLAKMVQTLRVAGITLSAAFGHYFPGRRRRR